MGYRFTLDTANIVANLSFGKVMSCYRDIMSDREQYNEFLYFLENFHNNFYSKYPSSLIHNIIRNLQMHLEEYNHIGDEFDEESLANMFPENRQILEGLYDLADIISRCRIKSLLLPCPYFQNTRSEDDFMISKEILHDLVRLHPADSCLILQPQERLESKNIIIFDAFPHFDVALRQIEQWPAVMFWGEDDEFVFVPIDNKKELINLYAIVRFEYRNPIDELKRFASKKRRKAPYYYFHLSDLHFGAKNVPNAEQRLRNLLKKHISDFEKNDNYKFIITGDFVDSPGKSNKASSENFLEDLELMSGSKSLTVPGNHDVTPCGLFLTPIYKIFFNLFSNFPKLEIDEENKVIFLLLNSNAGGIFARGEIGKSQLLRADKKLNKIPNLSCYRTIAVLHHHVKPINLLPNIQKWRKWHKLTILDNIVEYTLELKDANKLLDWLKKRGIQVVLHGHKHMPFIDGRDGINVIACGSSTGKDTLLEKGYISYNILAIGNNITCTQYVEEIVGGGVENINVSVIN